jgi:hypothetical protein
VVIFGANIHRNLRTLKTRWNVSTTKMASPANAQGTKSPRKARKLRERWWTWHWDRFHADRVLVPFVSITRWRCGSFLTVYRMHTDGNVQWWFYGPFNLAVAFSYPVKNEVVEESLPKVPEYGKYWN